MEAPTKAWIGSDRKAMGVGAIFECSMNGGYNGRNFYVAVRITVVEMSGTIDWKPFTPAKGFVPRQITPKPKQTPTPTSSGSSSGALSAGLRTLRVWQVPRVRTNQ